LPVRGVLAALVSWEALAYQPISVSALKWAVIAGVTVDMMVISRKTRKKDTATAPKMEMRAAPSG
jgi:hypothetical protein